MRPTTLSERRRLYLLARVVVARNYRRPLTIAAVARALASSPRQVQRAYSQFGSSFQEDLAARRMAAAAQLLAEQAIPVHDVARLVGYTHRSHFARAFRLRYGVAPARFRERARTSARGRRTRIEAPPPGVVSTRTEPPCCSTTWRTIARPSPEPGRLRASAPR
jgi:AraC-like DNA-binding protein